MFYFFRLPRPKRTDIAPVLAVKLDVNLLFFSLILCRVFLSMNSLLAARVGYHELSLLFHWITSVTEFVGVGGKPGVQVMKKCSPFGCTYWSSLSIRMPEDKDRRKKMAS